MAELRSILARIDLAEYADTFISEGFDTWEILTDITESDLNDLNVKLGHRRKLQRAIAESKAQHRQNTPGALDASRNRGGSPSNSQNGALAGSNSPSSNPITRTKRKYRRHPRPDPNAPERPASAYVRFSNRMRQELADQELSFIEMAKVVGDRWQALPSQEREWYESQASADKETYNAAMTRYKRTEQYARYQQYLADFKSKANSSQQTGSDGGKRPKLEADSSSDDPGRSGSIVSRTASDGYSNARDTTLVNSASPHTTSLPSPRRAHRENGHTRRLSDSPSVVTMPTRSGPSVYDLTRVSHSDSASSRSSSARPPPILESGNSSARSGSSRSPLSNSLPSLSSISSTDSQSSLGTPHPELSRVLPPLPVPNARKYYNNTKSALPHEAEAPMVVMEPNPRHSGSLAALLRAGELMSARESDPSMVLPTGPLHPAASSR